MACAKLLVLMFHNASVGRLNWNVLGVVIFAHGQKLFFLILITP